MSGLLKKHNKKENNIRIKQIFNEIQECGFINIKNMTNEAHQIILKEFNVLITIFEHILCSKKRTLPSKVIKLLKNILEKLHKDNKICKLKKIIRWLIDFTLSKSINCRKHSLQLIGLVLNTQNNIFSDFFDKKENKEDLLDDAYLVKIAERVLDKEVSVRKEAIKICKNYQNKNLHGKFTVEKLFKHVISHDTNKEMRKLALCNIEINKRTLSSVFEKCIDLHKDVRMCFWKNIFKKIDIFTIEKNMRIFLLKRSISEFGVSETDNILIIYLVKNVDMLTFIKYFDSEETEYELVLVNVYLTNLQTNTYSLNADELIKKFPEMPFLTFKNIILCDTWLRFIKIFYSFVEASQGRDSLILKDFSFLLEIMYNEALHIKEAKSPERLKLFFDILNFYDIFAKQEKKKVFELIKKIILELKFKEIFESCILLLIKIVSETDIEKTLGCFICKLQENNDGCFYFCLLLLKNIKNLSKTFVNAIFNEKIKIRLNESDSDMCLLAYFYFLNHKESIEESDLSILYTFSNKNKVIGCICDLIIDDMLSYCNAKNYFDIENYFCDFFYLLSALVKIILAGKIHDFEIKRKYIVFLLVRFYSEKRDFEEQKLLNLFIFEYFSKNQNEVVDFYCLVLSKITYNQYLCIDHLIHFVLLKNACQNVFCLITKMLKILHKNETNKFFEYFVTILDCTKHISIEDKNLKEDIVHVLNNCENKNEIVLSLIEHFNKFYKDSNCQ